MPPTRKYKTKPYSSVVWRFFQMHSDPRKDQFVVCVVCGREYSRDLGGSTSNLLNHIKNFHSEVDDPPLIPESRRVQKLSVKNDGFMSNKRPRTNSSYVWNYFLKPTAPNQQCTCDLCGATFKSGPGDQSTTRLWSHLQRKHPAEYEEGQRKKSDRSAGISDEPPNYVMRMSTKDDMVTTYNPELGNTSEAGGSSFADGVALKQEANAGGFQKTPAKTNGPFVRGPMNAKRKATVDALVTKVITSDLQPCSFVENRSFRALVKALDPYYELPSKSKLSDEFLPRMYEAVQQDVKLSLQLAEKIAVTLETWVSWSSQQYMTITAHTYSATWEKKTLVLSTTQIGNDMTATEVTAELRNIFMQWEIEGKVFAIVTESSSALVNAVHILGIQHVPCVVNTLDRIVKEALKNANDVVAVTHRVRGVAAYFQYSKDGVNMLRELQGDNVPAQMLVKDEEARWMSTLNMFRCYLEQHEVISGAFCFLSKGDDCLTEADVGVLKKVVETLEPFELAAEELCVENSATLSTVIPILKQLQECLSDLQYHDFALTSVLLTNINNLFTSLESNFIVGASTVLDPRFKHLSFDDPDKVKSIESHLMTMLSEKFEASPEDAEAAAQEEAAMQPKKSLWNRFDNKVKNLREASCPSSTGPAIELRRYFESRQPRRQEIHACDWWKTNESVFPNLAKVAQQFLAIPASSAPANLIFSKANETFLAKRSCLEESSIDKMLFLNKNFASINVVNPQNTN